MKTIATALHHVGSAQHESPPLMLRGFRCGLILYQTYSFDAETRPRLREPRSG